MITLRRLSLLLCFLASSSSICLSQQIKFSAPSRFSRTQKDEQKSTAWKEFSSAPGGFSVLLPGIPEMQATQIDTLAGQIPNITYTLAVDPSWFIIMYSDMPVSSSTARQTDMLNAGRDRMLAGDKDLRLVSETDIWLAGHPGREWVTQDKDSVTKGRAFIVNGRVYAMMFGMLSDRALKSIGAVPTAENRTNLFEENSAKFLDSFKFSERNSESLGEVDRMLRYLREERKDVTILYAAGDSSAPAKTPAAIINGKAIHLVAPAYPAIARSAHASGQVSVQVVIDLEGKTIAAQVLDGHPLLRAAAIKAARESEFTAPQLNGKPAMVVGVIIYNFVPQ
jgi:TonB family protein